MYHNVCPIPLLVGQRNVLNTPFVWLLLEETLLLIQGMKEQDKNENVQKEVDVVIK